MLPLASTSPIRLPSIFCCFALSNCCFDIHLSPLPSCWFLLIEFRLLSHLTTMSLGRRINISSGRSQYTLEARPIPIRAEHADIDIEKLTIGIRYQTIGMFSSFYTPHSRIRDANWSLQVPSLPVSQPSPPPVQCPESRSLSKLPLTLMFLEMHRSTQHLWSQRP